MDQTIYQQSESIKFFPTLNSVTSGSHMWAEIRKIVGGHHSKEFPITNSKSWGAGTDSKGHGKAERNMVVCAAVYWAAGI